MLDNSKKKSIAEVKNSHRHFVTEQNYKRYNMTIISMKGKLYIYYAYVVSPEHKTKLMTIQSCEYFMNYKNPIK